MHSIEILNSFPAGRVLAREIVNGKHVKMRICGKLFLKKCDVCSGKLGDKFIKHETTGNMTLIAECFKCFLERENK